MFEIAVIILILSFLVIIHELGHFLSAKFFKIKVEEFGLGYPPAIMTLFRKWNTDFTLNWIPFGGFVRMEGEDGPAAEADSASTKKKAPKKTQAQDEPFYAKPSWQRMIVILAGAAVNFVFGILAFSIFFSNAGLPTTPRDISHSRVSDQDLAAVTQLRIQEDTQLVSSPEEIRQLATDVGARLSQVLPDSPAAKAGLQPGTQVVAVSVEGQPQNIETIDQAIEAISQQAGQTITITTTGPCTGFECQPTTTDYQVYVRTEAETPPDQGATGVAFGDIMFVYYPWYEMPVRGTWFGLQQAVFMGQLILAALSEMVVDITTLGSVPTEVAGPVGIVHQTQQSGMLDGGWLSILNFAGLLSVNLAIMNVLPIPALDGGRAVFIMLEWVIGKKRVNKYEGYANYLGYGLLLTLIILVTIKDIVTIFR